ncbi:hypothetical protein QJ48_24360 [Paenibacillus sp. A3]|uniref:YhfC family glutamic-type intramembrane protease n=1 Tax=Paenibacillus sp. A3 TaxID=1337054 RepID=UPI0006D599C3|nr:YhfC family glutamic-type intramembrane protease [Paenibacillus sp. A3]KPV57032.1 hypothetical protein QJ48_24360 [Paenibacillus sp. A3]
MNPTQTTSNEPTDAFYDRIRRRFYMAIPLYLAVPAAFWLAFRYAGFPADWAAFGIGAAGWWAALLLRGPIALLVRKQPKERAGLLVAAASGPLEEGVRLLALWITGFSLNSALSLGQGWAAIEVVFAVVNGIVLASIIKRTDEKAMQAKAFLESTGQMNSSPLWGVLERLFASMFHIGSTLLIAHMPWLLLLMIPAHTGFNLVSVRLAKRSLPLTELFVAAVGIVTITAGLLVWQ